MAYAVFPDDEYYHLVRAREYYTLCGLPTLRRDRAAVVYRPPARVVDAPPPSDLCPRCEAGLKPSGKGKSRAGTT